MQEETFEIQSGKVYVCDPCRQQSRELPGFKNVRTGKWKKIVNQKSNIVNFVIAAADQFDPDLFDWTYAGHILVDSGMAGIFDQMHYYDADLVAKIPLKNPPVVNDDEAKWYNYVCDKIYKDENTNSIIPFGFVTRSGFGDFVYPISIAHQNGEVVGIMIEFVADDESDEEKCMVCAKPFENSYCSQCDAYSDDKVCFNCMTYLDYDGVCPDCGKGNEDEE